jgi:ribosome assembly protein YihI (activator of Der GTPase)
VNGSTKKQRMFLHSTMRAARRSASKASKRSSNFSQRRKQPRVSQRPIYQVSKTTIQKRKKKKKPTGFAMQLIHASVFLRAKTELSHLKGVTLLQALSSRLEAVVQNLQLVASTRQELVNANLADHIGLIAGAKSTNEFADSVFNGNASVMLGSLEIFQVVGSLVDNRSNCVVRNSDLKTTVNKQNPKILLRKTIP